MSSMREKNVYMEPAPARPERPGTGSTSITRLVALRVDNSGLQINKISCDFR